MDFESIRKNYLRMSYAKAAQERKLPQWFLKQGLFWLLRTMFMILLVIPVKFIWQFTGRDSDGLVHLVKFCVGTLLYFVIIGALICSPFMQSSSAAAQ